MCLVVEDNRVMRETVKEHHVEEDVTEIQPRLNPVTLDVAQVIWKSSNTHILTNFFYIFYHGKQRRNRIPAFSFANFSVPFKEK